MSEQSQGAGWWVASDGKWYPPHQHPGHQAAAPASPAWAAPPMAPTPPGRNQGCVIALAVVGGIVVLLVALAVVGLAMGGGSDDDNNQVPDVLEDGPLGNDSPEDMSLSEFQQISTGMTYAEVVAIVGGEGNLSSSTDLAGYVTELYVWTGNGTLGANANVMFQNGAVVSKAQFGLN